MVAANRELPASGYALEIDGQLETEFATRDGARAGGEGSRSVFPCFRSGSMTRRPMRARKSGFSDSSLSDSFALRMRLSPHRAYMNGALSTHQWSTKTIADHPFSLIGDVRYWRMRTFHRGNFGRE